MSDATANEQYLLELINASRATAGLQPLALNTYLNDSAQGHTDYLLRVNKLTHTGEGGSSGWQRMGWAGYDTGNASTWGENIGWRSISGTSSYQDEITIIHDWLMNSSGHRANILNGSFREVGIGINWGPYQGYNAVVATEDFAATKGDPFLLGVAYADRNTNGKYDVGEGLSGVSFTAINATTGAVQMAAATDAGGYALQLPAGTYNYTFSADGLKATTGTVTVSTLNVKVDWVSPAISTAPADASSATPPPVNGTAAADTLAGTLADDMIYGMAGNDRIDGRDGADQMFGGTGNDTYYVDHSGDLVVEKASEGTDSVYSSLRTYTLPTNVENLYLDGTWGVEGIGNSLSNKLYGNSLDNHLVGGAGNDTLNGRSGADAMEGGTGDDTYYVDNHGDVVVELAGQGADLVSSVISYTLTANVEKLTLTGTSAINGTGNDLANVLTGNTGANVLIGLSGDDQLVGNAGNDRLEGGDGNDVLQGGSGQDTLIGGAGADRFDWDSASHTGKGSAADIVLDFQQGQDRLDFSTMDANTSLTNNQAFSFIGQDVFHGVAGELRFEQVMGTTNYTVVQGDINGDKIVDFEVRLDGQLVNLQGTDFIL